MPGICGGDRRVTCRAGCLNDLNTTRGQEQPEEAQDAAADAAADAEAVSHAAAAAQAAADDGTANEQTKQGAATRKRKRAAEPRDDASEDQPRLARIPCTVC